MSFNDFIMGISMLLFACGIFFVLICGGLWLVGVQL